jgi:hypothetical protein
MKRNTTILLGSLPAAIAMLCTVPAAADDSNPYQGGADHPAKLDRAWRRGRQPRVLQVR